MIALVSFPDDTFMPLILSLNIPLCNPAFEFVRILEFVVSQTFV